MENAKKTLFLSGDFSEKDQVFGNYFQEGDFIKFLLGED